MSQQTLFAICLLAGAVAMVSAQSFNWQSCSKSLRAETEKYRTSLMGASQKFTNSLQQTAGQATDTNAFNSDIDKLIQSVSSLGEMSSQSLDAGRLTNMYIENLQTIASLFRSSFRLYLVSGAMDSYMEFGNTLMATNTQYMQAVTQACMPARRVQPASVDA